MLEAAERAFANVGGAMARPGRERTWAWFLLVALVAVLLLLRGFYRRELYHFTGAAEWMWVTDDVRVSRPTVGVFAVRLSLHDRPQRAVAKVCGERQYVLWVNGQPAAAGQNRPRFQLDVVPVTDLLTAGANVIAIEARSHTSVGAVLFALDLEPSAAGRRAGDPRGRNVLTSGSGWRVSGAWEASPDRLGRVGRRPWIWGRPPDRPWSYPQAVVRERPMVQAVVSEPLRIEAADFSRTGDDRWLCRLPRELGGFLWLEVSTGEVTPLALAVGSVAAGGGLEAPVRAPVVVVPGEERWLFPGFVRGDAIVAEGPEPPRAIELVEAIGE